MEMEGSRVELGLDRNDGDGRISGGVRARS